MEYNELTVLSLDYIHGTDTVTSNVSASGVFHTLNTAYLNATNFGAIGIRDPDLSIQNTYGLGTTDMAMIVINLSACFPSTNGIEPGKTFIGRFVPEIGASGVFLVSAPNAFDNRVVEL